MKPSSGPTITLTHSQFLISAAAFEGLLLVVAFGLGWLLNCHPTAKLYWSLNDFWLGILATIPLLLLLAVCLLSTARAVVAIRVFLRETMGPLLNRCNLLDLLLLALLAGLCEEILFLGFIYFVIEPWNATLAVFVSNLAFGAAHAITPFYAMLASFMGLYLTALVAADSTPNLLIPITAHTFYDFVAFLVVVWDWRKTQSAASSAATTEEDMPEDRMPDDSLPDDSLPDDSLPDDSLPDDSLPDDSVHE